MNLLFIHQNFPGQYRYLLDHFVGQGGHTIVGIGDRANIRGPIEGVRLHAYPPPPPGSAETHHYIREFEGSVRRGQTTARILLDLKTGGFRPDVVCIHPGWGDGLFLKDVFPDAKVLAYLEYFYNSAGTDVGFDPEYPISLDDRFRVRMKNSTLLHSMVGMDWGVSPTRWQFDQHPVEYRERISIIHEGVHTGIVRPNPDTWIRLAEQNRVLTSRDEVITFVNRNLEPYRGFHSFMRAIPEIQRRRPNADVLIIGGDEVSYGVAAEGGRTYRQQYLAELGDRIDLRRVHFLGKVPYDTYLAALQVSSAHVYLTYPFVLGWSMLEAMSAGCALIGSATPPVMEVIRDGENGLLVDFFSPTAIAAAVDRVLSAPDRMAAMRANARRTIVERYDLKTICLPRHLRLIETMAAGGDPATSGF